VYNDLDGEERARLEAHMAACSACRAEADSLKRVVALTPAAAPELERDLLPVLRARLAEARAAKSAVAWRWAAVAACALLAGLVAYSVAVRTPEPMSTVAEASPLDEVLDECARLMDARDYGQVASLLARAIEEHPRAPRAAEAQLLQAKVAFENLQWYPEACAAYQALAERYPGQFQASPESIRRRDVLVEAARDDFEPLYALDTAKQAGDEAFARLEAVVARYPGTFVASLAADNMAELACPDRETSEGRNHRLVAMTEARARCTDPVAMVQLTLEMGHICWEELSDFQQARAFYTEAADNDHTVLAQRELAQDSLRNLPQP